MISRTLVLALLSSLVLGALLTHLLVEAVSRAFLATWMTLATNCFSRERFQSTLLHGAYPFVIMSCGFYNKINFLLSNTIVIPLLSSIAFDAVSNNMH
jgi:hypothetical protein